MGAARGDAAPANPSRRVRSRGLLRAEQVGASAEQVGASAEQLGASAD